MQSCSSSLHLLLRKLVEISDSREFFSSSNLIDFKNNGNEQKYDTRDSIEPRVSQLDMHN